MNTPTIALIIALAVCSTQVKAEELSSADAGLVSRSLQLKAETKALNKSLKEQGIVIKKGTVYKLVPVMTLPTSPILTKWKLEAEAKDAHTSDGS